VEQAVRLIRILLEKGYAYWHGGDVFFDPLRFTGFGALYGLDMSRWPLKKIRFRKDTYPGARWNLGDFILWHGSRGTGGDISWDTEIGKGRPSWNIQDPAMIAQHMGYEIDVSCGGIDNLYRHHDYNKAVLEAVSGVTFAPYWMHGQHLLVQGKKMSKSKGNITYPEDILDRGFEPYHLRYYLLSSHYRSRLDFTWESFRREAAELDTLRARIAHVLHRRANTGREEPEAKETIEEMALRFRSQMNDDLDVAGAVSALRVGMERLEDLGSGGRVGPGQLRRAEQALREADSVLGVLLGSRDPDR
jgi:cysteinyl-tRNA synthetase